MYRRVYWNYVLVYVAAGVAMANFTTNPDFVLIEALAVGCTVTVLVYATFHISGGVLNPAITMGMLVGNKIPVQQAVCYGISQLLGGITGCLLLILTIRTGNDQTRMFGANQVNPGYEIINGFVGEMVMSFLLVFVVLQTSVDRDAATRATLNVDYP